MWAWMPFIFFFDSSFKFITAANFLVGFSGYKAIHTEKEKGWGGEIPSRKNTSCIKMWHVCLAESILSPGHRCRKSWSRFWYVTCIPFVPLHFSPWCCIFLFNSELVHPSAFPPHQIRQLFLIGSCIPSLNFCYSSFRQLSFFEFAML